MSTANKLGTSDAPFIAGGAITQYSCVKISANGTVSACTAITDQPVGVAQNAASAAGDQVDVLTISGAFTKVRLGGTVSAGVAVMVKGSGTGEVDTAAGATAHSVGQLITGGVSGDIVTMVFRPALKSPANS